jgi:hypothetical protein
MELQPPEHPLDGNGEWDKLSEQNQLNFVQFSLSPESV